MWSIAPRIVVASDNDRDIYRCVYTSSRRESRTKLFEGVSARCSSWRISPRHDFADPRRILFIPFLAKTMRLAEIVTRTLEKGVFIVFRKAMT
ncbi:hypothetical protein Y032_0530g3001 [Ancylostoma ceylanicum]|nr:hypothetical protein Y032_0530g3001 [Ancylostoma ceylanicum]